MSGVDFLYVAPQLGTGGLERQLALLCRAQTEDDFGCVVVVWNHDVDARWAREIERLGVSVIGMPRGSSGAVKVLHLRRLVRRLAPSLVHSYSFYLNAPVAFACMGLRTKVVGSIRNDYHFERANTSAVLGRLSGRLPAMLIANNDQGARNSESAGFWGPRNVVVVPNAVDLDSVDLSRKPDHPPLVLGVGRLAPEKRWDRLIDAASILVEEGSPVRVLIAGGGPLQRQLVGRVADRGIEEWVEFLGERLDIAELMSRSSALVLTSEHEGCPNVVLEAMAAGRPVITTDAGDAGSFVTDGKTGLRVAAEPGAIAKAIGGLARDAELAHRCGMAARSLVEKASGAGDLARLTREAYRRAGWVESRI